MARTAPIWIAAGLAALMLAPAGPAAATQLIYSYDSASPITLKMTENGVTFVLDKGLMHTRVLKIIETQDVGSAELKPAPESDLGRGGLRAVLGPDARERDLYEILPKEDGKALSRALCHGSDRAWLAFGLIKEGRDLKVRAIDRDPATGQARLCLTLDYAFHGEWSLPPAMLPQPDRTDRFNDAPANRRY